MNKSLGNIYRNSKSLSGLNNIDAFNLSVDGVLKTANVSNIDSAITTLQSGSGVDLTTIESEIDNLQTKTDDITENNGSYVWNLSSLQKDISFQVNSSEKLNIGSSITVPNGALLTNSIRPNITNTYNIGQTDNFYSHAYLSNITTSSITDLNTTIGDLETKTTDISRPTANSVSIGGTSFNSVVDINCQLSLPNILHVENEIIGIGNAVVNLQTKTNDLSIVNTDTLKLTDKTLYCYGGTIDTTIVNPINSFTNFNTMIQMNRNNYRAYRIGLLGDNSGNLNHLAFACDTGATQPKICMSIDRVGDVYINNDIYITNGSINTSDERHKYYIQTLEEDKMLEFVKNLNPVRYKWKSEKEKKGNRFHCGLIAQDVKKKMPFDFGGLIHDKENDKYGLRYNEMIAPLISVIQQLIKRIEKLENPEIK